MTSGIVQAIPVPAFSTALDETLVEMNGAFLRLFPNAVIGRSYLTVLRQPDLVRLIENAKSGDPTDAVDLEIKGQSQGFYRATCTSFGDGVLVCLQDRNETASAIQMRQNFVADLSHELKTPLTAIAGILETSAGDADALSHFLPALEGEVMRMRGLVGDLLTLSNVESNERRRPTEWADIRSIIEQSCAALEFLAVENNSQIEKSLPLEPLQLQCDPDEIRRAVGNLIENALRYGDRGGVVSVRVSAQKEAGSNLGEWITIEVANNGPGVEAHHIPRLTERFYRVDCHRSRNHGGSGLGLAIVKHVIGHHRGRMTIESPDARGFRVVLALPITQE